MLLTVCHRTHTMREILIDARNRSDRTTDAF